MNQRSNGLWASAYAILVEIEESLGDPMLAELAARDIAAYVEPTAGPGGTTRLNLYVDVLQRTAAAAALAGMSPAIADAAPSGGEPAPTTPEGSDEAAFAALVEAFHRTPEERTWPDAEDLPAAASPGPGVSGGARPSETVLPTAPLRPTTKKFDPRTDIDRRRPVPPAPAAEATEPTFAGAAADDEDDEEHYIPPPLSRLDPAPFAIRWALVGLLLGLAMLLVPTFLDFGHQTSLDVAGVLCVLGSGAVLVSRLRDRSPDDPDDGAVV
jgi:hypothetical protein